ncbi:MAG: hypothetical protein CMI26_12330 [Opitutae bacterium]|nr:hypothetical protein [Opitutae bacterium]
MSSMYLAGILSLLFLSSPHLKAVPDFKKDVLPILQESCIDCHAAPYKKGTRLRKPKGGYRVDTRENILKAGDSEEAGVIPGNAKKSELYKRIILEEDHDDIMPPKGDPLTPAQQKVIKGWIDAGAVWASGVVLQRKG